MRCKKFVRLGILHYLIVWEGLPATLDAFVYQAKHKIPLFGSVVAGVVGKTRQIQMPMT